MSDLSLCPSLPVCPSFAPVLCPGKFCMPTLADCPELPPCPPHAPYRCPSGECVEYGATCAPGIRCPSTIRQPGLKVTSCPDAIARVIEKVVKLQKNLEKGEDAPLLTPVVSAAAKREVVAGKIRFCPECGKPVEHEGGCVVCRHCGYSKCG